MLDSNEKIKYKYVVEYRMTVAKYIPVNLSCKM
jgi:hypothetical protein